MATKATTNAAAKIAVEKNSRIDELRNELQNHQETRDSLASSTTEMQLTLQHVNSSNLSDEEGKWKMRYHQQLEHNARLEAELARLQKQTLKTNNHDADGGFRKTSQMSLIQLKHYFQQLQKEKAELEWKIHNYEWSLNKEAKVAQKVDEEKEEILTGIKEVSFKLPHSLKSEPAGYEHSSQLPSTTLAVTAGLDESHSLQDQKQNIKSPQTSALSQQAKTSHKPTFKKHQQ